MFRMHRTLMTTAALVGAVLGARSTFAQIESGYIVAWGDNASGQTNVPAPNSDFIAIAGGGYHSLGLKADGSIVAWGLNDIGQADVPPPNAGFIAVAAGLSHSLGLKADGSIVGWGYNFFGQANVPLPNSDFIAVAGGGYHSLGLKADESIVAWGSNDDGQTSVSAPNANFIAVAAGYVHSLGLKADGSIVAWGNNGFGQTDVPEPNTGFIAVAAGHYHSLGLKPDGSIVVWGNNSDGQTNVPAPNANFIAITAGYAHSLGLKSDGSIVAWGRNLEDQINVPAPNTGFIAVAGGGFHSLAIRGTGSCSIGSPSVCQEDAGAWTGFLWASDATLPTGEVAAADDFVAQGSGLLSKVCVIGTYLDPSPGPVDCTGSGYIEGFTVSIYANGGDGPGVLIESSATTVDDSAIEFTTPGSNIPFTRHQLSLTTPIGILQTGTTYWIEVQNNTVGGPPGCNWYWLHADSTLGGNGVFYLDGDGNGYDVPAEAESGDFAFCLNLEMGTPLCPLGVPPNDTCPPIVSLEAGITAYDTFCSSDSLPPFFSPTDDVWYSFIAPCTATASVTVTNNSFESHCFKVYPTGTSTCSCPGAEVPQSCSTSRTFPITDGQCYLLRVGTGPVNSRPGFGTLDVSFACPAATTFYVNYAATGLNNGTRWVNAFTSLQTALTAANPGDQIWAAKGTYKPAGPGGSRSATFQLESGAALYGGFTGGESDRDLRDPVNNVTILSGDLNGNDAPVACTQNSPDCDSFGRLCIGGFCIISNNNAENSYHVVTGSGADVTAVLDGFIITAGNADGTFPDYNGGGMYNNSGSPTVTNCTFRGNRAASFAGAMLNNINSSPTLTNCSFRGNSAFVGGAMVNNVNCNPTVTNCTFAANSAVDDGGGMLNAESSPTVTNCAFSGNLVIVDGGGMYNYNSSPSVTNCTFDGNSAGIGGGMYNVTSSAPPVTNCTFSRNSANGNGGGMYNDASSPTATNCIFWKNVDDADASSGGPFMDESAQIHTVSATPAVNYSIVQGGWTGAGNIGNSASDPLFVDADGADNIPGNGDDDLRLGSGSPAIDSGNTPALPSDPFDLDQDGITSERSSLDLGGNPRILDDANTPGTSVDMGALEHSSDCNNNGRPDPCEVSCGLPDGPCDIPACGGGADCNTNNVLDACDIENCAGSAACDDCNLNGKPDGCDIASGFSLDNNVPLGVPDECTAPNATANWTDNVWNLVAPDPYPDNLNPNAVPDLHVSIGSGITLQLDTTVAVNSVRVLEGAALSVTDPTNGDLIIDDPGAQTAGVAVPPKIRLRIGGTMDVAFDNSITVVGASVTVEPGGVYEKEVGAAATSASLTAEGVTLVGATCDFTRNGALLDLVDTMTLNCSGDLTLDGTKAAECICGGGARRGVVVPPRIRIRDGVFSNLTGALNLVGATDVIVDSTQPVMLAGAFDNRSLNPSDFDWTAGKLQLTGTSARTFEVAGLALGQTPQGFSTDIDTLFDSCLHTNFSMGTVEVLTGANVRFVNAFANSAGGGCAEALYVHNLILRAGSTVALENCKIYYGSLVDEGASLSMLGCGELLSVTPPQTAMADPSNITKNRAIALSIPPMTTSGPGGMSALRVKLIDQHNPQPPNAPCCPSPDFSLYEFASTCIDPLGCVRWVGQPALFRESQDSPGAGSFKAARLQCTPYYRNWSAEGLFYVVGGEVNPSSAFDVQQVAATCMGGEESCTAVSAALRIDTARFGDVVAPFNPPTPSTQPDGLDVSALVSKFKNLPGSSSKALMQVQPNVPELNGDVSALDIVACVDAFKGFAYPFSGPCPCPSDVTCNMTACSTAAQCSGGTCVKTCATGDYDGLPCINNTHCPGGTCGAGFCRDRCGRCTP